MKLASCRSPHVSRVIAAAYEQIAPAALRYEADLERLETAAKELADEPPTEALTA